MHQQFAVLGAPIAHSKSPLIHAAAYECLGLPWSYDRVECEAAGLSEFLATRGPEWCGLSLTMPLKEEAQRLATVLDPVAERSGVVNTMLRLAGDAGWAGFNTDVGGLANAIERAGLDATDAIVIGSGATAVSAVLAAQRLGAHRVRVIARNSEAVAGLEKRFGVSAFVNEAEGGAPSLVISTVPAPVGTSIELPPELLRVPLFDVAYEPWPSPLALRWQHAAGEAHSGYSMLVEQAIIQIRIFRNGTPEALLPEEDSVREAMFGALRAS